MTEPAPILDIQRLSVSYPTPRGWLHALDEVSLAIPRGRALGLVGESGSGKSTFTLAMLGLLGSAVRVEAARARFADIDLLRSSREIRGKRIGTVFQDPSSSLNPSLTIGFQIAEPMILHLALSQSEAFNRSIALLSEMGVPRAAEVARAFPHQLSGGMKQRAMIAAALAPEPDLLLLDEPTTALDVTVEAQILDLLERLRAQRGLSMLLVSHNLGIVDRICDEVAVLYAGQIVEWGPTSEVLTEPRHPYTRGLITALPRISRQRHQRLASIPGGLPDLSSPPTGCRFLPRCAFAIEGCEKPQQLPLRNGRAWRCQRGDEFAGKKVISAENDIGAENSCRDEKLRDDNVLVKVEEVSRSFVSPSWLSNWPAAQKALRLKHADPVRAVDKVSIAIRKGEVLGLVGESGSGKSTLGMLILRLLAADAGRISLSDVQIPERPDLEFRQQAQIIFQNPDTALNPRHTVGAILRRPLQHFRIAQGAAADREVERLLLGVSLPVSYRDRYPHQLSGGEKQRVSIARALASRPKFLVCDEAVSALDVSVQAVILNLLSDLRDEFKITYLFITHDIGVVSHIADRVAVMYFGGIVEEGPVELVLQPPYHPYTEALLSSVPIMGERRSGAHRVFLRGEPGGRPPSVGCRFAARCPRKIGAICDTQSPPWQTTREGHRIACHIPLAELSSQQGAKLGAFGKTDQARKPLESNKQGVPNYEIYAS